MRQFLTVLALTFVALAAVAQNFDKAARETLAAWRFPGLAVAINRTARTSDPHDAPVEKH